MPMGAAIAGSAVLGAMSSANAADAQSESAAMSTAEQRRQYDQTRQDQAPWREAGLRGLNKMEYLLGTGETDLTRDQVRQNLLSQFTQTQNNGTPSNNGLRYIGHEDSGTIAGGRDWVSAPYTAGWNGDGDDNWGLAMASLSGPKTSVDEAGLNAAIDAEMARMAEMKADPDYGSLLRDFGLEDFTKDPGYDFRLSEGEKGINRSLAARGGLFSGAAGKALSRYNQDFASNEYGNAYNRYNTNQGNKFNRLASLAGIGQSATNQVQQAGQNAANNISSNMIGSGNAQASGIMGIGNAISGGLNNYMQYNMMNKMLGN